MPRQDSAQVPRRSGSRTGSGLLEGGAGCPVSRRDRPRHGHFQVLLAFLLVGFVAGCSTLGFGESEPETPDISGEYTGTISLQGQQFYGDLEVQQEEDGALELSFQFPELGLTATGTGQATPAGFTAEIPYTITCPGTANLEGVQSSMDRTLTGSLVAEDCESSLTGTFRFAPQD